MTVTEQSHNGSHNGSDPLLACAFAVAARQRSENTRRAYSSTYRSFCAFLRADGGPVGVESFTLDALRSYCDSLESQGRSKTTVARHLSALRSLAEELGLGGAVNKRFKGERLPAHQPTVLTNAEYELLLSMPDIRTARGRRDLAILRLLGDCGLRRSELCALTAQDIVRVANCLEAQPLVRDDERTCYELVIHRGKPTLERRIPLTRGALEALFAWRVTQPTGLQAHLFVSVRGPRTPLSDRMIAKIVRKYAERAEVGVSRVNPHALRHTFCARLAKRGASPQQIAELAGHLDLRTSRLYTNGHLTLA